MPIPGWMAHANRLSRALQLHSSCLDGPVAFITSIQLNAKSYRGDHVSLVLNYEPPFLDHHPCYLSTAERPIATRMIQPASVPN